MANGALWSRKDVYRLLGYAERLSQPEAARRLGRSLTAVQSKIRVLGIRWRQGMSDLNSLARELECSITTVQRMASILFKERIFTGRGRGRRYCLTAEQALRLRGVLEKTLEQRAAHRAAGRARHNL